MPYEGYFTRPGLDGCLEEGVPWRKTSVIRITEEHEVSELHDGEWKSTIYRGKPGRFKVRSLLLDAALLVSRHEED